MKFFFCIFSVALLACSNLKHQVAKEQGIQGYIYQKSGNQMPSPGRKQYKGKGVSREILIYEVTTINQAAGNAPVFNKINTRLIATTHSDTTGYYEITVSAGKYSVFIKDGGSYFANESDDKGVLNPVEVIAGKITSKDLILNRSAVY